MGCGSSRNAAGPQQPVAQPEKPPKQKSPLEYCYTIKFEWKGKKRKTRVNGSEAFKDFYKKACEVHPEVKKVRIGRME